MQHVRPATLLAVTILAAAACGGSDGESAPLGEEAVAATTAPPTTAAPTTAAPTTVEATTTIAPTTAPPTTEPCGSQCPPSDADQVLLDEFFAAYDGGDWDAFLATLGTDDPTWRFSPTQTQPADLMRYDMIWAHAIGQTTEPESCVDQYGTIRCTVIIEDDFHRALIPYGGTSSTCTMSMTIEDGGVVPGDFSGFDCFRGYDLMMHLYGEWFAEQYPDQPRIDGFHYRAWNQTDETAGARAAEHLDEFIEAVVAPHIEGGGELIDLRVRGGH